MIRRIAIIVLIILPFAVPRFIFSFDVPTLLTVVSLIFAILVGFFFAAATSNYLRLQTLIAEMNAGLISLFSLTRVIQPDVSEDVGGAIDHYMMAALDYELLEHVPQTEREFDDICEAVDKVEPSNEKGFAAFSYLQEKKELLRVTLQEVALTTKTIIGRNHWLIIGMFAVLIGVLMLSLRDGTIMSSVIIAVVMTIIYLTLDLLYMVDTNLFLAKKLEFQSAQQVFSAIGRLPYYPSYAIKSGAVRKLPIKYRQGDEVTKGGKRHVEIISGES